MESWYYVEKGQRQGPIPQESLLEKLKTNVLSENDYVWKKGFDNWKKVKDIDELQTVVAAVQEESKIPPLEFDSSAVNKDENLFLIKTGADRAGEAKEYGPFSLNVLVKLYKEKRVNGKTLVFAPGMKEWMFLAELPNYQSLFEEVPPPIAEQDRRIYKRKPFLARMFFHDTKKVYEGICRDISVGGMQVLVANFPGKAGDKISLNVHPENSEFHFVANGKIVRVLDEQGGFSFRFTDLGQDALSAISSYVNQE